MTRSEKKKLSTLAFIPFPEINRMRKGVKDKILSCEILADIFRINTLYMIEKAGSGHIGSSFSAMDIVTWLWMQEMKNPNEPDKRNSDIYFSSKGHDVPALYSVLIGLEKLDFNYIHKLRRLGGLPGHPDVSTPYIMTNTGPLGLGVSKAMGMASAKRLDGETGQIYVMTGDGELQEGALWESLQPATNGEFGEITVVVDHNKIQSDAWVREVSDLGDLDAKFRAFGWEVERCDGHDFAEFARVFSKFKKIKDRPKILIADTVKGKGVSFTEKVGEDGYYKFHSGALSFENYCSAFEEITERINKRLADLKLEGLNFEHSEFEQRISPENPQRLVSAYGDELVKIARRNKDIVAMDADLVLDTGLIPFKNEFPDRYMECGIAEQHMVSLAGGLALSGKLPIVHSFACFLSTRANEQIYNNSTEKTKIIYVGSLAGLLPGGPGHSHQSVRDISTLGSIPGLTLIEPCNGYETRKALRWAVETNPSSTYIRLVSIPVETPYKAEDYELKVGTGVELVTGRDAAIIAYGPVMLTEAVKASKKLKEDGVSLAVYNNPWLNKIDQAWLLKILRKFPFILTLDDHYTSFGQGMMIAAKASELGQNKTKIISLGLQEIPECGLNPEVLAHHKLDAESLRVRVKRELGKL